MSINSVLVLFLFLTVISAIRIPLLQNATLIPISNASSTIINNQTCDQCLCRMNSSHLALNCFPSNTCQFFSTYPRTYTIQSISQARLYFLQQILPDPSQQCCMPNTSYLMSKINTANGISVNMATPHCMVLDNDGYVVTVSAANNSFVRLYPRTLSIANQVALLSFPGSIRTVIYYNESYYIGFDNLIILMNATDFTVIENISASVPQGVRDMIFLQDRQTLVVTATDSRYILFFNRTDNYSLIYEQPVTYSNPHGLTHINDSFFYVTSWGDNTVYSYSAMSNSVVWMERLILDARSVAPTPSGNHLRIDECGRYWFILGDNGIRIFDDQGSLLANISNPTLNIFDVIIMDDYIIYLSDIKSNQIVRIDPGIQCP